MKSPLIHFLLALVALLIVSSGYSIWYTAISQKSSEVATVQNEITTANENVSRISSARAALVEIAGDEATVQSYFVSETGVVPFINDLEARGQKEGATTTVLSVSKTGSTAAPALLLALSLQGTFDAVMRTVGAIEYAPYAVSISTLSVSQDAKNSWHADLSLMVGSASPAVATSTP